MIDWNGIKPIKSSKKTAYTFIWHMNWETTAAEPLLDEIRKQLH